jgi:hypothetical protein
METTSLLYFAALLMMLVVYRIFLLCAIIFNFQQYSTAEISGDPIPLTFGVVQTAYSNGSSTKYFKEKIV